LPGTSSTSGNGIKKAFSSEVGTGSRQENASEQNAIFP
jgi:hypothetical protein